MVLSRPHLNHSPKILLAYETLSETHWNASYIEQILIQNTLLILIIILDQNVNL